MTKRRIDTSDIPEAGEAFFKSAKLVRPKNTDRVHESAVTDFSDFHEVWWIYSGHDESWGGLRIAHFRKAAPNGDLVVIISGEADRRRIGLRIWDDVRAREGWIKVKQIEMPSEAEIARALTESRKQ